MRALQLLNRVERRGNEEARKLLRSSIALAPDYARAHALLSWAIWPQSQLPLGHMAFGWVLLRAGRFDEAITETGQALSLSPLDSFSGFYTAIQGLALLGKRRFEEALPFLRSSVAAFADMPGTTTR